MSGSSPSSPHPSGGHFSVQAARFVCLNCGTELIAVQCKVKCPRCGYFEDCSDGGNDHPNVIFA